MALTAAPLANGYVKARTWDSTTDEVYNGCGFDIKTALNAVAGNIFPVCRKSHHVQKRGLTDLPTIFCVLIDNTDQDAFKFHKVLLGE